MAFDLKLLNNNLRHHLIMYLYLIVLCVPNTILSNSFAVSNYFNEGHFDNVLGVAKYSDTISRSKDMVTLGIRSSIGLNPLLGDNLSVFLLSHAPGNLTETAKKAKEIICEAKKIGTYIDGLTGGDLVKMPLVMTQTVGNIDVEIVFNSAKIYPQYAQIEVFVRLVIPQREVNSTNPPITCTDINGQDPDNGKAVLYFGAKDIYFSQEKGIIRGSIGLLSDYAVKLGDDPDPKIALLLKQMVKGKKIAGQNTISDLDDEFEYSGTYINFDCNGFREMGVGGRMFFSRDWIIPTNDLGHPAGSKPNDLGPTARVRAEVQVTVQDWNDLLLKVNLSSPFTLAAWDKMSFAVGNAHLDLSSYRNPPSIPSDDPEFIALGNAWEGVFIENLAITLPSPFKRASGSIEQGNNNNPPPRERIKVSAKNMLIDAGGVSGNFAITGEAPLIGGPVMDGEWGWSLDEIGISLENSTLTGFNFAGVISAPIFDNTGGVPYTALIDQIGSEFEAYQFTALLPIRQTIPVFNAAKVTFGPIQINVMVVNEEFTASATFSSILFEIGNPNDYSTTPKGSPVKLPAVELSGLRLSTGAPRIELLGGINFPGGGGEEFDDQTKVMNFPVIISAPNLSTSPNNPDELAFNFKVMLNLVSQNDNGVEATAYVSVLGDYTRDINGARHWKYKSLGLLGGTVIVNFPQVYGEGNLCFFEDDEPYGKGFSAGLSVELFGDELDKPGTQGKFKLEMMAIFGNTDGYRYFLVDGFLTGEAVRVEIFPGFFLDGFGGGVFHNMEPASYTEGGLGEPSGSSCASGVSLSGIVFEPTEKTKFGIKFSTSFAVEGGLASGMLTCIIQFGQTMNLRNITFWGVVDIMPPSELTGKKEFTQSDFEQKIDFVTQETDELKNNLQNEASVFAPGESGVKARLGLSVNFENNLSIHGYAEAHIQFLAFNAPVLTGVGAIDLLLDPKESDPRFHLYLGGYYPTGNPEDQIYVPNFFGSGEMLLEPASLAINYGGFQVSAHFYFLTGNDIPGPPPIPQPVIEFFDLEGKRTDNRELLSCSPNDPARGTGMAFGASAYFKFDKEKKGKIFCLLGYDVNVAGGIGFDISLLKYPPETQCLYNNQAEQGLNGFRAGGIIYAFIDLNGQHVYCLPIPPLGVGLMVRFDVPNPSYFQVVAVVKIGRNFRFNLELGEECGRPCLSDVQFQY